MIIFETSFTPDTVIALVALIVSILSSLFGFFANRRSNKTQEELNTLQLRLSEIQLEREQSVDFRADVVQDGRSHKLRIWNIGKVATHNISMKVLKGDDAFVAGDPNAPPWPCLEPGDNRSLTLGLSGSSNSEVEIELTWSGDHGSDNTKSLTVPIFS